MSSLARAEVLVEKLEATRESSSDNALTLDLLCNIAVDLSQEVNDDLEVAGATVVTFTNKPTTLTFSLLPSERAEALRMRTDDVTCRSNLGTHASQNLSVVQGGDACADSAMRNCRQR
jgi:hypothetical protein